MFYDSFDTWWWPFLFILLAGVLPNAVWRWAGVLLVGNIDTDSQWLVLVRCIATALVAAVIAQFVFLPSGALATFPLELRLTAALGGFASFLLSGNKLFVGVFVGEVLLLGGYFILFLFG